MTLLPTKRPEGEASGSEAAAHILRLGLASGTWALPVIIPQEQSRAENSRVRAGGRCGFSRLMTALVCAGTYAGVRYVCVALLGSALTVMGVVASSASWSSRSNRHVHDSHRAVWPEL